MIDREHLEDTFNEALLSASIEHLHRGEFGSAFCLIHANKLLAQGKFENAHNWLETHEANHLVLRHAERERVAERPERSVPRPVA